MLTRPHLRDMTRSWAHERNPQNPHRRRPKGGEWVLGLAEINPQGEGCGQRGAKLPYFQYYLGVNSKERFKTNLFP